MRILVQRVTRAAVSVEADSGSIETVGRIGPGFLLLVGIGQEDIGDGGAMLAPMAEKLLNLRVFPDEEHKMNRSLLDMGGALLVVSQFTLHADMRRGRRPGFTGAAPPEVAEALFNQFVELLRGKGVNVQTGRFGAMMQVELVNDGPVTLWLDSQELFGR